MPMRAPHHGAGREGGRRVSIYNPSHAPLALTPQDLLYSFSFGVKENANLDDQTDGLPLVEVALGGRALGGHPRCYGDVPFRLQ